ncbi:MAG: hypothetical protein LAO19_16395 [Acidobacteriia bacterium]|nr:hypothetical protein [Terriglobia bacterium]
MMRKPKYLFLLYAAALGVAGCGGRHIVRAAPPSVSTPPPDIAEPMPVPETPPPAEAPPEPPPAAAAPAPPMLPAKRPAPPRARPAPVDSAEAPAPKPAPPQISPQLSARDLAATKTNATRSLKTAEENLAMANGRQLNATQKDLADKIAGFNAEAHAAIIADDWVRAQNLAEKARVLSEELKKTL